MSKDPQNRNAAGMFVPGNKANPGGRPKAVIEVVELARAHTPQAMQTLAEIMTNEGAPPAARVAAASVLLDRGWGKAPQTVEHTGTVKFEDMTPEQRAGRIAALMAQLGYDARH